MLNDTLVEMSYKGIMCGYCFMGNGHSDNMIYGFTAFMGFFKKPPFLRENTDSKLKR